LLSHLPVGNLEGNIISISKFHTHFFGLQSVPRIVALVRACPIAGACPIAHALAITCALACASVFMPKLLF